MVRTLYHGLGPSKSELDEFYKCQEIQVNELGTFNVYYYKFNKNASDFNIYDEALDRQYFERIPLNAAVIDNPSRAQIEQTGVFQDVDLILDFSSKYLEDNEITFSVQDFILYNGIEFDIIQVDDLGYIGNENELDRVSHNRIKLLCLKRIKRIQKNIQRDGITIKKRVGFLWNVD